MEYKGKLYGKVNDSYFKLEQSTDDFDSMLSDIEYLTEMLNIAKVALNDIANWNDDLINEWGDPGERAISCLKELT
jgi:hypothetical protein